MKKFYFNKIIIIQCLSDGDLSTGRKLREELEDYCLYKGIEMPIEFYKMHCADEFKKCLSKIAIDIRENGNIPILHVEIHGDDQKEGLIFPNKSFIHWNEFKELCIKVTIPTKLNLLVVLAACHGAYFTPYIVPHDRAPCWGLIGPVKAISQSAILKSFSLLYKTAIETKSISHAIATVNKTYWKGLAIISITNSEEFFKNTYSIYLSTSCNPKAYRDRAKAIRKEIKKKGKISPPGIGGIIRYFEKKQRPDFHKNIEKFFMFDLYPGNAKRFIVKYEDFFV